MPFEETSRRPRGLRTGIVGGLGRLYGHGGAVADGVAVADVEVPETSKNRPPCWPGYNASVEASQPKGTTLRRAPPTGRLSYPDVTDDWVGVLDASSKSPGLQPLIETERQDVTKQLRAAVARGRDLALQIRSMVRGKMGPRSELLTLWKVPPLRKRPRKVKPDGETPGTAPGMNPSSLRSHHF